MNSDGVARLERRDAHHNVVVNALTGVIAVAESVRAIVEPGDVDTSAAPPPADEFVDMLLGVLALDAKARSLAGGRTGEAPVSPLDDGTSLLR